MFCLITIFPQCAFLFICILFYIIKVSRTIIFLYWMNEWVLDFSIYFPVSISYIKKYIKYTISNKFLGFSQQSLYLCTRLSHSFSFRFIITYLFCNSVEFVQLRVNGIAWNFVKNAGLTQTHPQSANKMSTYTSAKLKMRITVILKVYFVYLKLEDRFCEIRLFLLYYFLTSHFALFYK